MNRSTWTMYTHTLLLVDDSITTQREMQLAFADELIRVVVAGDGREALDRIEADPPDIVVASTTVPDVDGYAIARYVSQQRHLQKVVVLVLTDTFESPDEQRIKESGAKGVVQKPLDRSVVIARVKEILGFGEFDTALDAIDASMKEVQRPDVTITPEALAQIVSDAVAQAIAAYERARGLAPEPARDSEIGSGALDAARDVAPRLPQNAAAMSRSPWKAELERLQGDMGLDDIEFDEARPQPAGPVVPVDLPAEMGIDEFVFDDVPPRAAEPEQKTDEALAAWDEGLMALAAELGTNYATRERRAPLETRAPDSSSDGATPLSGPAPFTPIENDRPAEESGVGAFSVAGAFIVDKTTRAAARVRAWMANLASRFRSALADRAQRRAHERAAANRAPDPPAPAVPALLPRETKPAPAPSKPVTPEEAAATVFFTFDPIPPVPPRLPREPRKD